MILLKYTHLCLQQSPKQMT